MQFERVDDRQALVSECRRLEGVLQGCEEWRALLQVKARLVRGGGRPNVHSTRLEASLLRSLDSNAYFQRYRAVVIALSQMPGRPDGLSAPDTGLAQVERSADGPVAAFGPDAPALAPSNAPALLENEPLLVERIVFLPTPLVPPARRPPPLPLAHPEVLPGAPSPRALFANLADPGKSVAVRIAGKSDRVEIARQGFIPGVMAGLDVLPPPLSRNPNSRPHEGQRATAAGRFLKALTGY